MRLTPVVSRPFAPANRVLCLLIHVLDRIGPIRNEPGPLQKISRILPEQLNFVLVPPEPGIHMLKSGRENIGREYWTGFVCSKCKLAQERDDWSGWRCKLCDVSGGYPTSIF